MGDGTRVTRQLPVENRLGEGPQRERVGRGHEVDRPAHDPRANDRPVEEQLPELVGIEVDEARPQRDVGIRRLLRLESDEMLNHVDRRHRDPLEQELAGERGPIEGADGQHVTGHG